MRLRSFAVLSLVSFAVACGGGDDDGGASPQDALPDAAVDAGTQTGMDADPVVDTGVETVDTGVETPDTGVVEDTGPEDTGGDEDTGISDVPSDQTDASDAGVDVGFPDADPVDTGPTDLGPIDAGTLAITPMTATVTLGSMTTFMVNAPQGEMVEWAVEGIPFGSPGAGAINPTPGDVRVATYLAPRDPSRNVPSLFEVTATAIGETARATVVTEHPAPTILNMTPSTADAGGAVVTATITGTGFTGATRVLFGGVAIPIREVEWSRIVVNIPTSLLQLPGQQEVAVVNPTPGGGRAMVYFMVILRQTIIDTGIPANIKAVFDSAMIGMDPMRAPRITYPSDMAVAPRDFPAPEISWAQAPNTNVCRVNIDGPAIAVELFARSGPMDLTPLENPFALIDDNLWPSFFATGSGFDIFFTVSCGQMMNAGGVATLVNNTIDVSNPVTYRVSNSPAGGRLVYFSGIVNGLVRVQIGGFQVDSEAWIGNGPIFRFRTPDCVGCHSFNGSGSRMSYADFDGNWGVLNISGVQPTVSLPQGRPATAEWTTMSPNGAYVLGVDAQGRLNLNEAATGRFLLRVPTAALGTIATQPAWSPTGDEIAFVSSSTIGDEGIISVHEGRIYKMSFSTATGTVTPTFGRAELVASSTTARGSAYYPSFSPDGQWLAFVRAADGDTYANPGAKLFLMRADLTVGPVPLDAANVRTGLSNSWPRWAPTTRNGRYWLLFSSERVYPVFNGGGPQQLWVTHIDPASLPLDPSSPAVWLPGQEPFTGNLTAEWSSTQ